MFMIAVIFDLDNTLYDAEEFFSGAFAKISNYLSAKYGISQIKIYKRLMKLWREKTSMYGYLFNDLLNNFGIVGEIGNLVKLFNEYEGEIKPYSDVIPTLRKLREKKCKLGIVSDGTVERQKKKIKILGIADFFDAIIYTKEIGSPKPSHIPFLKALEKLSVIPQNSFYVADNPKIDFVGAKKIGMRTVRILRGEFRSIPSSKDVDFEIENFDELIKVVKDHEQKNCCCNRYES